MPMTYAAVMDCILNEAGMTVPLPFHTEPTPNNWDRGGLPAWTYHSEAILALERSNVFLTHWQVVGHVSDLPNPGDFRVEDISGSSVIVMRGQGLGWGLVAVMTLSPLLVFGLPGRLRGVRP